MLGDVFSKKLQKVWHFVKNHQNVKPQQGKGLPIRLPKTADSEEVLKLAVAKQSLHNGNEIVHISVKSYKLPRWN